MIKNLEPHFNICRFTAGFFSVGEMWRTSISVFYNINNDRYMYMSKNRVCWSCIGCESTCMKVIIYLRWCAWDDIHTRTGMKQDVYKNFNNQIAHFFYNYINTGGYWMRQTVLYIKRWSHFKLKVEDKYIDFLGTLILGQN